MEPKFEKGQAVYLIDKTGKKIKDQVTNVLRTGSAIPNGFGSAHYILIPHYQTLGTSRVSSNLWLAEDSLAPRDSVPLTLSESSPSLFS